MTPEKCHVCDGTGRAFNAIDAEWGRCLHCSGTGTPRTKRETGTSDRPTAPTDEDLVQLMRTLNLVKHAAAGIADAIERLTRERDEAREYAVKRSEQAHAIELELHARADAAHRQVETLREALEKIKRVPSVRYTSGHLHDCAWCNGSADIACAAIAETEKK